MEELWGSDHLFCSIDNPVLSTLALAAVLIAVEFATRRLSAGSHGAPHMIAEVQRERRLIDSDNVSPGVNSVVSPSGLSGILVRRPSM